MGEIESTDPNVRTMIGELGAYMWFLSTISNVQLKSIELNLILLSM